MKYFFIGLSFLFSALMANATHIMGGEITWECQGNQYVFELAVYRDCNQTNINASQETIKIWNNPSLTSMQVFFVERIDISPKCTPVTGSPAPILCGSGSFGGNGPGAIEKVVYRSNPITLVGTPPAAGWILTYDSFSRNTGITNLVDPTNHGITITATIFKTQSSGCVDSSPQFQENPVIISCKGENFTYNMNAFDPDSDSLVFTLGKPLNNIQNTFNPPSDPIELAYESGFSYLSPTPDATFDSQNQVFILDEQSGAISFLSHTIGNFVLKVEITSYKNGEKWSSIQREFQILVQNCLPTNDAPIVTSDIPTTTAIDVIAGGNVHIDFTFTDNDLLQDGQTQTVTIMASGEMFGANFTSTTSGCSETPCATLSQTAPISFQGTQTISFDWNTDCKHLLSNGVPQNSKTYTFVLQAKDNYCPVPKFVYKTIQVNVLNPDTNSPNIACVQTQEDGSYILTLENTAGIPTPFYIKDEQNNTVSTINDNTQTSVTIPAGNYTGFHIDYTSSCSGSLISSPIVKPITLILQNPQDGTAVLQWNAPATNLNGFGNYYYIYREYPAGNRVLYDSVPNNSTVYRDTISICKAFFKYQVEIQNGNCFYASNIEGDTLKDKIAPAMPEITGVSIDTLTGNAIITWNTNQATDTYGYVVYKTNANGILYEIDTVYGSTNTYYAHNTNTDEGAVTYSISAFDSCYTETTPVTFQTSAKSPLHTSVFATYSYDPCAKIAHVSWTAYNGWNGAVTYELYKKTPQAWILLSSNSSNSLDVSLENDDSTSIFIKAINSFGVAVFSNVLELKKIANQQPAFHYTKVATVAKDKVHIKHYIEVLPFMSELIIERKNDSGFEEIGRVSITGSELEYIDESKDIDVNKSSYTYRVLYADSCGFAINPANEVTTILNRINQVDEASLTINVHWSPYSTFDGGVAHYDLFRSVNDTYEWPAVFSGTGNQLSFEDRLDENIFMDGKVCYYVVAREGQNIFGFTEESHSNEVCYIFEPLIYIPNAFTPNGHNPIFFPVVNLAEIQNYSMVIYDRWNGAIFTSDDIHVGWDGMMHNGKKAPFGVYGYQIKIQDGNGKEIRKTGHVAVIWSD